MSEFRVPTPKELQKLRKKAGLTQSQLASQVGISQSLVARIEKGQVNPSPSTLKRILHVIEKPQESHSTIKDLLKWKSSTTKIQPVIAIQTHEKVRRAVNLMRRHGISQLPVFKQNTPVGSISESTILRKLMLMETGKVFALSVQEIMEAPFPTIDIDESVEAALMKIASGVEAILVMDGERPAGLLTKIDLIAYTRV